MATPKVFIVHLRRPRRNDYRSDPFYEFGSFGCTKCHSKNLLHPNHAEDLKDARLAFVQGGEHGSRLVLLTPPVTVTKYASCCEVRWTPAVKPFKYLAAPILACNGNDGKSDCPSVERYARGTRWGKEKVESGLSSRFRSRTQELDEEMANDVIKAYKTRLRKAKAKDFASTYDETMCPVPKCVDGRRKETYDRLVAKLNRGKQSRCARSRRRKAVGHLRSCD